MDFNADLSDRSLFARLRNEEDHFVERKTSSDLNDSVKTVVAFANSAPIGIPCVLYIGAYDDGRYEEKTIDFDSIQKSLNNKLKNVYPRVPYIARILSDGDNQILAVIVQGSELRPHFAGPSYIRVGSESIEATTAQLNLLIAQRSSKVYRLSAEIGKRVSLAIKWMHGNGTFQLTRGTGMLAECNEFWVTVNRDDMSPAVELSFPLERVHLSYDNKHRHLELNVTQDQ